MAVIPLLAMVRKDLLLFFSDRRSVIVSFVVPIAIASFFGAVFAGNGQNREPARIAVAIVDQDGSAISKAIIAGAETDKNLKVAKPTVDEAREAVKKGRTAVAVVIPPGFGEASGQAFFSDGDKPVLTLLHDPSKST
jgi:ABC-2 type transport system permease protein